jgi:hypothetical protein
MSSCPPKCLDLPFLLSQFPNSLSMCITVCRALYFTNYVNLWPLSCWDCYKFDGPCFNFIMLTGNFFSFSDMNVLCKKESYWRYKTTIKTYLFCIYYLQNLNFTKCWHSTSLVSVFPMAMRLWDQTTLLVCSSLVPLIEVIELVE